MSPTVSSPPRPRGRLPRKARAATQSPAAPASGAPAPRGTVLATEALLLGMAAIWGVNYIVVKFGAEQMGSTAFNSVRLAVAAVLLLAIAAATSRAAWPSRRDTLALLGLGVLGNFVYQIFFIEGLARTTPGTASLVLASGPALIAVVGRAFGVERVTGRGLVGIAASIAGVALVMLGSGGDAGGAGSLAGNALCFGGAICWALFTVALKPYTERVHPMQLTAITMVGGAVPLLVLAAPQIAAVRWAALTGTAWSALFYSCVLAIVVAYSIFYRGVRVIGPTRTSMFSNVQPFVALLAAWAFHYGVPTPVQLAGAVGIMAGVLLTRSAPQG
jgi:drug/metabolite transporter (DMT)-like permease